MGKPERETFGTTSSGETVQRVSISGGGLTAKILTWGSVIQDLRLEGHDAPLTLGFNDFESYERHSPFFGATPGRCANRIGAGRFELEGIAHQLELNENNTTHLHGGSDNIARRNWTIVEHEEDVVVLKIVDPAGRAGYPGNCTIQVTYRLRKQGDLSVSYETTTDAVTLANVCQHSYFNLDGSDTILDHQLMIAADSYLPTNAAQVPTGEIAAVAGTPFDFRQLRPIRQMDEGRQLPYDHNFCLSPKRQAKRAVALVRSPSSGVSLEVRSTEPGVQFYSGFKLDVPVPGLEGRSYKAFSGFCLETQIWPDAVNHAGFPDAVLHPGEVLRQQTDYIFSKN